MQRLCLKGRLLGSCAVVLCFAGAVHPALADPGPAKIETVTVTGSRAEASNVKKDAPNVVDVQSLQAIRALPDVNAAEALQRIPGVSMESDSGEGRFINIRGMDADLNGTTYDGVKLTASNPASPQGGGRAVAFDAFPSGMLGGIEVVKSLTPDMDAEGLGGVVNILPRNVPVGQEWMVDASVGSGLEPLRNLPVWQGDVTAGTHFGLGGDDDRFTVIASYAYHEDWRGIDDVEEDYLNDPTLPPKTFDDLQMRWYRYHRTRQGYGGALIFDVNDDTRLYVRGIHAGYTEIANKQRLQLNGLGDSVTSIGADGSIAVNTATARQSLTVTKEDVANDVVEIGGNTIVAGAKLDARGSWTKGSDAFPVGDSFTFKDPNNISLVYNNIDPRFPSFHTTDGTDLTRGANYTDFSGSNGPSHNSDEEFAGKADVSIPLPIFSDDDEAQFGGSIRARTRKADASSADFNPTPLGYDSFSIASMDRVYYDGHYNVGPAALFDKLAALPQGPQIADPTAFEDDNENVYAGYGQFDLTYDDLYVVGGLRVEATNATYRANLIDSSGNVTLNTAKRSYTDLFPDANFKYRLEDDIILRAAYSEAIARPGFNQITAATNVDLVNDVVSKGNPDLKPTTGQNVDLSAEYYDPDGGIASIALFQKWFGNYIIPTVQLNVPTFQVPNGPLLTNVEIDSFANIGAAQANGIELDYTKQFKFLPEGWDGLGVDVNATFVGSRGQIRPGEKHTLPQTSSINYNAAVFYQEGPFNLRLAAGYVSRNIFSVGGDAGSDVYSQPRFRLDFGGSYNITDNVVYYLDVKNLSNTKLEFTQTADKNFPIQREFYDATYLTGIRVKFGP